MREKRARLSKSAPSPRLSIYMIRRWDSLLKLDQVARKCPEIDDCIPLRSKLLKRRR
jgi:hypothetical protein